MYRVSNMHFDPNYLEHWGVLGMKWGVRRYQNPDGTLTAAGKARYGENGKYEYRSIGQRVAQKMADRSEKKYTKQFNKITTSEDGENAILTGTAKDFKKLAKLGDKEIRAHSRLEAYKKRDADRLEYAKKTSTGKAIVQTFALGGVPYQRARSRGDSRARAIVNTMLYNTPVGGFMTMYENKKKYGHMMLT